MKLIKIKGVLTLGTFTGTGISIPPRLNNFTFSSYCFNSCLNDVIFLDFVYLLLNFLILINLEAKRD